MEEEHMLDFWDYWDEEILQDPANLRDANLYGANLYGANLYGANLYGANLYGANLRDDYSDPFYWWEDDLVEDD